MSYRRSYGTFYGGRKSTPKVRDYKKDISRLSTISGLDITDLKKIERFLSSYPGKKNKIEAANTYASSENQRRRKVNEDRKMSWEQEQNRIKAAHEKAYVAPIESKLDELKRELENYKISFIGSILSSQVIESTALGSPYKFKGERAKKIISLIETLYSKRSAAWRSTPEIPKPAMLDMLPRKKLPNDYTVLTISGIRSRVFYSDFNLEDVKKVIAKRQAELAKEKDKVKEIKARADRTEAAVRNQAKQYLKGLSSQLRKLGVCPYCGDELNQTNFHQDHIHPVSKGGLSLPENLVFVCSSCNLKKKNKSLRVFVREQGFNFDLISDRLDLLGKH